MNLEFAPKWNLRLIVLVLLVVLKVVYSAITPFTHDFQSWVNMSATILSGARYFGIYTGPAYIFAATYYLWLLVTKDSTALSRLVDLFSIFSGGPRVVSIPLDLVAFTLFMKIPLLIADVATMRILMVLTKRLTGSSAKAMTSALLWASSPLVVFAEMAAPADIFPALLILLGVYTIYQSRIKSGSFLLALGTILRFAPLLFDWIYVAAFLRTRQFRNLISFLAIQLAFLAVGIMAVGFFTGGNPIVVAEGLVGQYPGIRVQEALSSLGLFVQPQIGYNPYQLGLSLSAYMIIAYYLTKRAVWNHRIMGTEALALLAAYFGLTSYYPHFLLWIIPIFTLYAVVTKFGSTRFLLATVLGAAIMAVMESKIATAGNQKAVFFIPTVNPAMLTLSMNLYHLDSLVLIPSILRSVLSAILLLLMFWIVGDIIRSSTNKGI
jgi:hypothetical protein